MFNCYLVNLVCLRCCVVCLPEFSVVLACLNNVKIALIFLVEKMHRLNMIELFLVCLGSCAIGLPVFTVLLACIPLLTCFTFSHVEKNKQVDND